MRKGWEIKTVADVCKSASSNVSQNTLEENNGDYPIYGASGIIKNVNFYHRDKPYLSIVKDGSGFGRITIMPAYTSVIGTLQYIIPNDEIDLIYLYYNLLSIDFKKYVSGAAIPHIYFKDYKTEPFLWMPIKEQKELVAIINDAFESIERAKSNAEQNLKNSKELFESYLHEVFENGKNIWEEKKLDEVCDFRNGAAHEQYIDENGKYLLVNSKFISSDGKKIKRTNSALSPLFSNDIAFVMSDVPNGKALAKCFLIDKDDTYTLNQRIGSIKSKVFVPEFLVFQFNRNEYLLSFNNGENQTNLRKGDILNCPLWLPTKSEQLAIVRQLDDMLSETQKLEFLYQQKLNDLEELKKSILQKAFNGELKTSKISA
jgi:type I restriction enzyme S subunit